MILLTAWTLTGTFLLGGDADAIKKDRAALQGTWKVTLSVSKGEKVPDEELRDLHLIFKGDAILTQEGGKTEETFSFRLDPAKKIKEIDLTLKIGPQKGRTDRAIYAIEDDVLRICIQTNKDGSRPTEFRSPAGSKLWLVVLQRTKK